MYPAAGIIIWIAVGAVVGWFGGKITRTGGPFGLAANTGVGAVAATGAGFLTTLQYRGDRSNGGFCWGIVAAFFAACLAVALFRWLYPTNSPRFE